MRKNKAVGTMNQKIRKILLVVLLLVFVASAGVLIYDLVQYKEGDTVYSEAESLVDLPVLPEIDEGVLPSGSDMESSGSTGDSTGEPAPPKPVYVDPYADALRNMDFTALQKVNADVLGWVLIPSTKISYPVVQGKDNDYYLNRTWKKTASVVGAIYMDYRCAKDLSGFNTILYGHRMNNGSMFAGLKYYKKQSYLKQHPTIYLTTSQGSYQYEIFSVYEGSPSGEGYRVGLSSRERKQAFLDTVVGASLYDTGVKPTVDDSVLTLSTCTGNGHSKRLIVHALRRGYTASDTAEPEAQTPAPETGTDAPAATAPAGTEPGTAAPDAGTTVPEGNVVTPDSLPPTPEPAPTQPTDTPQGTLPTVDAAPAV